MEKLKIIIADDVESSRVITRRFLETLPHIDIVAEVSNGEELVRQVVIEEPNLVLLDINMPKQNGINAIKECIKILPQLKVIIISGHAEYALEAFDFSAVDYLIKPIERNRLFQAIEKARQIIRLRNHDEWKEFLKKNTNEEKMIVHSDGMIFFINISDILFVEKAGRKNLIHTINKKYEINETLGSVLKRLTTFTNFIQTHRSFIINFGKVTCIKPSGETHLVYFGNYEEPAYISKNRFNELLRYLKKGEF